MIAAEIAAKFGFIVDQASITKAQNSIANFVAGARRTLTGLGLGLGAFGLARSVIGAANEFSTLHSRLGLVAKSSEEVNALWERGRQVARATRSDLGATVDGFTKIA